MKKGVVGGVTGFKETIENLRAFGVNVEDKVTRLAISTAMRIQRDAVRSIQRGTKTGRVYKRRGKEHRASAPGEAPATDTGALASSIARVDGNMEAAVGTGLEQGAHLEFGTVNMDARPWLIPAMEANRAHFSDGLKKIGQEAMKGVADKGKALAKKAGKGFVKGR